MNECDKLLEEAKGELKSCIILGTHLDGSFYVSSSTDNDQQLLDWMGKFMDDIINGDV